MPMPEHVAAPCGRRNAGITRVLKGSLYSSFALLGLLAATHAAAQTSVSPQEGDITVADGVRIHYVEGGDRGAKHTILFVPGFSMSSSVWRDQMSRFAEHARVVAIDPRSQGRSTITTRSNTPEGRAQDLRQVIQSLEMKDVVLVGWSQGVQDVAAYAAAFNGIDVLGYVLVDAPVGAGAAAVLARPQDFLKGFLDRMVLYQQHQEEYLQGMMNAIIQTPEGRELIDVDEHVQIGLRTPPDLGISMLIMDFIAYDRRPALAEFNRPTLVIASAGSTELDAQREMSGQIEDAQFEVIENAGHAVFLDQPQRFHDLLADFVRRTQAERQPAFAIMGS